MTSLCFLPVSVVAMSSKTLTVFLQTSFGQAAACLLAFLSCLSLSYPPYSFKFQLIVVNANKTTVNFIFPACKFHSRVHVWRETSCRGHALQLRGTSYCFLSLPAGLSFISADVTVAIFCLLSNTACMWDVLAVCVCQGPCVENMLS